MSQVSSLKETPVVLSKPPGGIMGWSYRSDKPTTIISLRFMSFHVYFDYFL